MNGTLDDPVKIGGLEPLTTIDYPGFVACVVFCQGCPWRCPFCYNKHLVDARGPVAMSWCDFLRFLEARSGFLDGVVFSGGEPLLQPHLPEAINIVRGMGFRVALHTGGSLPDSFARVLPMLDWVGLDIKAPFHFYERVTGVQDSGSAARDSLRQLLASGVDYETRTTADPAILSSDDIRELANEIAKMGVTKFVLQEYLPVPDNPTPVETDPAAVFLDVDLMTELDALFTSFDTRRAGVKAIAED
ncbi:MAG: anaerobic ribonucleoside-triphosphate reductase activating protein [Pseudomonadota bacterium]|nr:anaerobic ribonucleoside-triphosphate reductase activating protein [Pseudomonadota bacterium]